MKAWKPLCQQCNVITSQRRCFPLNSHICTKFGMYFFWQLVHLLMHLKSWTPVWLENTLRTSKVLTTTLELFLLYLCLNILICLWNSRFQFNSAFAFMYLHLALKWKPWIHQFSIKTSPALRFTGVLVQMPAARLQNNQTIYIYLYTIWNAGLLLLGL